MWLTAHKTPACPITTATSAAMTFFFHRMGVGVELNIAGD
jgi:hypothetical protein